MHISSKNVSEGYELRPRSYETEGEEWGKLTKWRNLWIRDLARGIHGEMSGKEHKEIGKNKINPDGK